MLAFSADTGIPFTPHENGQFTNPSNPFDVSGDGLVAPVDALLTINELNRGEPGFCLGPIKIRRISMSTTTNTLRRQDVLHVDQPAEP